MDLGLHVDTSHGFESAIAYSRGLECTAMQFFSGNPKTYRLDPIDAPALERFGESRASAGIARSVIHTSYLINLASEEPKVANNSCVSCATTSPLRARVASTM